MRSTIAFMFTALAVCSALLHTAPGFASDTTSPPAERVLLMAAVVAVAILVLGLALYVEVASLRPLLLRSGIEATAREEREESARQEAAKASADLYAALTALQEQLQHARIVRSPAEVAADIAAREAPAREAGSDLPRDTLTMPPPSTASAPPGEGSEAAKIGDDDPTSVLSREALQQAMAGEPRAPSRAPGSAPD